MREVAKADGSVGRIFEGHLNAYERLRLDGIEPEDHLLGVWGADPAPGEGEPASVEGDRITGVKTFCSGAGGLDRALVVARGQLVYVDLQSDVEIDKSWYRSGGMRASESHRVVFHGARVIAALSPLTREPYLSGDAIRTAASWAGILDSAVDAALKDLAARPETDDLRALGAGRDRHRAGDDRPLVRARRAGGSEPDRLGPASRHDCASRRDDPRRGEQSDRLAAVRDGHRTGPRPPRLRALRAAAPARPARGPAGPRTDRAAPKRLARVVLAVELLGLRLVGPGLAAAVLVEPAL